MVLHFWQECHRSDMLLSVYHSKVLRKSKCLTTGDVYCNHLVKVVSAGFPSLSSHNFSLYK